MTPASTVDPNSSQTTSSSNFADQSSESPSTKVEINAQSWNPKSPNAEWGSTSPSSSPVTMEPHLGNQTPVSWSPTPTAAVPYSEGSSSQGSNVAEYPSSVTPISTVDPNSSQIMPSSQGTSGYSQTSNPSGSVYDASHTPPSSMAPQGGEVPFVAPPDLNPDPTQAKIKAQARELKELKQSIGTPHSQESGDPSGLPLPSGPVTK